MSGTLNAPIVVDDSDSSVDSDPESAGNAAGAIPVAGSPLKVICSERYW